MSGILRAGLGEYQDGSAVTGIILIIVGLAAIAMWIWFRRR